MALVLVTAPSAEPISVSEVKSQLRIDVSDDDTLLTAYIGAVRAMVEQISGHALITQTWDLFLDGFPAGDVIELPYPPLQSVTGVYYTDTAGDESTMDTDDYWVDTNGVPGRVVLMDNHSWPSTTLRSVHGVRVRYVCGFGDAGSDVDERCVQAMKLLVGHYYEFREEVVVGRVAAKMENIPYGARALLADLRARAKTRDWGLGI